jgi:glycosyltransferase involved in cell wall biosynthesis
MATRMSRYHDVFVLTTIDQKDDIEKELSINPVNGLHVYYHSLVFDRKLRRTGVFIQFHYYIWQLSIFFLGRNLHKKFNFDLAHHVTLVRFWVPNTLAFLSIPFLFGPVGGGETAPPAYVANLPPKARWFERLRNLARAIGEHDPFVRATTKRAVLSFASTPETAAALKRAGAKRVEYASPCNLSEDDFNILAATPAAQDEVFRVISIARLIPWKGIALGLRAFAAAAIPDAEYWVLGEGSYRTDLEDLAKRLGLEGRVLFFGMLPRRQTLDHLSKCHVLLHPSLHDSSGFVCLEAMAAGRPVLCLALGGPALQVPQGAGFCIEASSPDTAVARMADHLREFATDRNKAARMGQVGRAHVKANFMWGQVIERLLRIYAELANHTQVGEGKET